MTTKQKPRRAPSEMLAICPCGQRFHKTAETVPELLEMYRAWFDDHAEHWGEK